MPNKECSVKTHDLVLTEYDRLTIIAKEETRKAVEWLSKQANKKKKNESAEKTNS